MGSGQWNVDWAGLGCGSVESGSSSSVPSILPSTSPPKRAWFRNGHLPMGPANQPLRRAATPTMCPSVPKRSRTASCERVRARRGGLRELASGRSGRECLSTPKGNKLDRARGGREKKEEHQTRNQTRLKEPSQEPGMPGEVEDDATGLGVVEARGGGREGHRLVRFGYPSPTSTEDGERA